tara:strand:+ start:1301 stop:1540 length:240 start_codon:yes stop_codon:yes gene_type:complete
MQKLFNVLAVAAFVMSGALVGLSVAAFMRVPGMIEDYANSMTDDITGKVTDMIPGQVDELMPEIPALPTETGPAITSPF